jgi:hypothetical protein
LLPNVRGVVVAGSSSSLKVHGLTYLSGALFGAILSKHLVMIDLESTGVPVEGFSLLTWRRVMDSDATPAKIITDLQVMGIALTENDIPHPELLRSANCTQYGIAIRDMVGLIWSDGMLYFMSSTASQDACRSQHLRWIEQWIKEITSLLQAAEGV